MPASKLLTANGPQLITMQHLGTARGGLHTLSQVSEDPSDRTPSQGYFFQFNSLDAQILVPGDIHCLLHQCREDSEFVY